MNHRDIQESAYRANMDIVRAGLVLLTWGNASSFDPESGIFAIKPSGVDYNQLSPENMVLVSAETGLPLHKGLRPSSDTDTHAEIYRSFDQIRGVVHTHSHFAVVHAQSLCSVPLLGTTHADHFRSPIPVTRTLSPQEISLNYELNTGKVIAETFRTLSLNPLDVPAILVAHHGPFTWGPSAEQAVENAIVLEEVARMGIHGTLLTSTLQNAPAELSEKHFTRKHGPSAYYGQS